MKKLFPIILLVALLACNNSKKEGNPSTTGTTKTEESINAATSNTSAPVYKTKYILDGKEINAGGSLLVSKDKDKLQPGADYLCMLTASGGANNEGLVLNFLLALKTGTYPIVGTSLTRGPGDKGEVYGGILGGKPKLTNYKVTITECKDLGSNNFGGHKWSISGSFEGFIIPAMGIMLMDKTKNHPTEVKIDGGSFTDLTFDDNWEEVMKKAMDKMKEKKN